MSRFRILLAGWTLANLVLSIVIVGAWWRSRPAPPAAVTAVPATEVGWRTPEHANAPLVVTLPGAATIADDFPSDAPATLLRVHPAQPGRLRFVAPRRLEFVPDGAWPAAQGIEAMLDPRWRLVDGRELGAQAHRFVAVPFVLDHVAIVEDERRMHDREHVLRFAFSAPVAGEALRARLAVDDAWTITAVEPDRDAGDQAIPVSVRSPFDPAMAPAPTPSANRNAWRIALAARGEPTREALFTLGGDLRAAVGDQMLGERIVRKVPLVTDAGLVAITAGNDGLRLRFTHQVALPADDAVTLVPPRPVRWRRDGSDLVALCTLAPGELVRVQAAAGFPGLGRFRTTAPIDDVVRVADARPSLAFPQRGSVLSAAAEPVVTLTVTNLERVRLRVRRVYDNNAVRFANARWHVPEEACTPWRQAERAVAGERNRPTTVDLDLRRLWADPLPAGWYELEAGRLPHEQGDGHWVATERKLVQVTDIACAVRWDAGDVALRAWSLAAGTPLADARVTVRSPTDQRLVGGATDADGCVRLQHATAGEDERPFVVIVEHGDDRVALPLERFRNELVESDLAGALDADGPLQAWLWNERGLVRPGEELRFVALLRDPQGRAPFGRPLSAEISDGGGRLAATIPVVVPADGLVEIRHPVPHDGRLGAWRCRLRGETGVLAERAVRVEPFVPDRIAITATVGPTVAPGLVADPAALHAAVAVRWTTGEPCVGAAVAVHARAEPTEPKPGGVGEGFSFAPLQGVREGVPPGLVMTIRTATSDQGVATARIDLPRVAGCQALAVLAEGEAVEPGGRALPWSAQASVALHPVLIGVRARRETEIAIDTIACDARGVAQTVPALAVRLERRRWEWNAVERDGRLRWEWRVRREVLATTEVAAGAAATFPVPAEEPSTWLAAVVALAGVDRAETALGAEPLRPDRLRFQPVAAVAPGGTATLVVASPIAGDALVTLEGGGVLLARRVAIAAGDNRIELPVPAGTTRPNLHAVVVVATGQRAAQGPLWVAGGAPVPLLRPGWSAPLALTVAAQAEPGAPLPVRVQAPGLRRALVAAVDEAVLARTAHPAPDPLAWFARRRALAGQGATSLASLLERPRWPLAPGGDGDDDELDLAGALAGRQLPLDHLGAAAWWTLVELDDAGDGACALPIGDFEGRLRVVAVGAGGAACAAARADCLVRAPLGLRLAVPRVLAPGDRCRAVATVTPRTGGGRLTLRADGGAAIAAAAPAARTVAEGAASAFDVALDARAADDAAAVTLTARLEREDGSVLERVLAVRLPVRPPARRIDEAATVPLDGPTAWRPSGDWAGPLTATIANPRGLRDRLRPALDLIVGYPYGCGEQVSARLLALSACAGFDADGRVPGILPHGVARLRDLERDDGFGWWPGWGSADALVTVQAVRSLLTAGVTLTAGERARWLDRLETVVRRDPALLLRCQALAALAEAGRPPGPWLDILAARAPGREERAWLAIAAAVGGHAERARSLLLGPDEPLPPREWNGLLRSPLRCEAVELRARLLADPADPACDRLAARVLAAVERPHRLTTQELAYALPALAAWTAQRPDPVPAPITVAGRPLAPGERITLPLAPGETLPLAGPAGAVAVVTLRGWRSDLAEPDEGVRLTTALRDWTTGSVLPTLARGSSAALVLTIVCDRPLPQLVLTLPLPAGCEPGEEPPGDRPAVLRHRIRPIAQQGLDDRTVAVLPELGPGEHSVVIPLRAVVAGRYATAGALLEAFYDPSLRVVAAPLAVEVP